MKRRKRVPVLAPQKKTVSKPLIAVTSAIVIASATLVWMFLSEDGGGPAGGGTARRGVSTRPEVVSALLGPLHPTAQTPLTIQYDGRGGEGDPLQFEFRWFVDNQLVQEGGSGALNPGRYAKNSEVYVEVVAQGAAGSSEPFRTPTVVIGNLPPVILSVSLSPVEAPPGALITAVAEADDPDRDMLTFSYQWFVGDKQVGEPGEASTFSAKGLKPNDRISVMVTASDRESSSEPKLSQAATIINQNPRITSTPSYEISGGVYTYQVSATDPDGDKLLYQLVKGPQGMTIDPATGFVRWELPKTVESAMDVPVKITADDQNGGIATQEFSFTVGPQAP